MPGEPLDLVIQFALACARDSEDKEDQALCSTELIKYVYLADLAHAERTGETFTGAAWKFHRFGPWAAEVEDRLQIAAHAVGGVATPVASRASGGQRFKLVRTDLKEALERALPLHVASAVKKQVRSFGSQARHDLLHLVYTTAPMLAAAPGERLVFTKAPAKPEPLVEHPLTARQVKKLRAKLEEARARRAAKPERARVVVPPPAPDPELDAYIQTISGAELGELEAQATFDPSFWRSAARRALA